MNTEVLSKQNQPVKAGGFSALLRRFNPFKADRDFGKLLEQATDLETRNHDLTLKVKNYEQRVLELVKQVEDSRRLNSLEYRSEAMKYVGHVNFYDDEIYSCQRDGRRLTQLLDAKLTQLRHDCLTKFATMPRNGLSLGDIRQRY